MKTSLGKLVLSGFAVLILTAGGNSQKLGKMEIKLTDLNFELDNYSFQGEEGGNNYWQSNKGDGLGIYFFDRKPDLPEGKLDIKKLKSMYEGQLSPINGKLVELAWDTVDGVEAIKLLLKVPQEPSGMTYIISFTFPFEDFSFVVKAQCMEHGITGRKEAILVDRHMQSGNELESIDFDKKEFDKEFPDHPVARARKIVEDIKKGLLVSKNIKQRKPYY